MATDFSALPVKGVYNVSLGHAPNLGANPIHFLWCLRHNTAEPIAIRALLPNEPEHYSSFIANSQASAIGATW